MPHGEAKGQGGEFGRYIRELRLRKALSQRELARLSGLNHSEISRIEGGSRPTPSPESLAKLAPHLGVTHEELMRRLGYLSPQSAWMKRFGVRWRNTNPSARWSCS